MTPAEAFEARSSLLRLYEDFPHLIGANSMAQDAEQIDLKQIIATFQDAMVVLWRPDLLDAMPQAVRDWLRFARG